MLPDSPPRATESDTVPLYLKRTDSVEFQFAGELPRDRWWTHMPRSAQTGESLFLQAWMDEASNVVYGHDWTNGNYHWCA